MTTFDEIRIQGYRRLADVRLSLRALNVVVGSGGAGKSSLLEAFHLLEQPEISLSPRMLTILVDVLREASQRTQLIVVTNSERLVRCLRPDELVVANAEEGLAKFTRADELELQNWLADYTLDQIWRMGRLQG